MTIFLLLSKLRDSVHRGSDGRIVIDSLEAYLVQVYFPFGCQHMDIFHWDIRRMDIFHMDKNG